MKNLKILSLIVSVIISTAFIGVNERAPSKSAIGTYGEIGDHPTIQLKINKDQSFQFIDETKPGVKINVTGQWIQKGNKIFLEDYQSDQKIPNHWKLEKDGGCVKGQQGMKFIRICNC